MTSSYHALYKNRVQSQHSAQCLLLTDWRLDHRQLVSRRVLMDVENPREVLRMLDAMASAILDSQSEAILT